MLKIPQTAITIIAEKPTYHKGFMAVIGVESRNAFAGVGGSADSTFAVLLGKQSAISAAQEDSKCH